MKFNKTTKAPSDFVGKRAFVQLLEELGNSESLSDFQFEVSLYHLRMVAENLHLRIDGPAGTSDFAEVIYKLAELGSSRTGDFL